MDLKCEIDCCRLSTCSVSWYFEGEEIDTRNTRYHTSSEGRGLVHVLSVDEPGMRDFGRYFCVLRSPLREGPDRRTITITVPGVCGHYIVGYILKIGRIDFSSNLKF